MTTIAPRVAGLVLAAGAGSRYGTPKALVRAEDGTSWLLRAVRTLDAAGCSPVLVVLGARGDEAEALLRQSGGTDVVVVRAADWADGLAASLRSGLGAAARIGAESGQDAPVAVAVVPVDVPGLTVATVRRLLGVVPPPLTSTGLNSPGADELGADELGADSLRQAGFGGRPGHPVVIGRAHWNALIATLTGDTGARPYLLAHGVDMVDCGDLETGADVDRPNDPRHDRRTVE